MSVIPITESSVSVFTIPTDGPESDGTLEWTSSTMVLVEVKAGRVSGLGYTYGNKAIAAVVHDLLFPLLLGRDAMDVTANWVAMTRAIRNQGRPGIASMAIAAVDAALWDVKARLLDLPLVKLLGAVRESVPVYGSGGFTSYPLDRLQRQLAGWVERGIRAVKMKVGRAPSDDDDRVRAAREAIGRDAQLFVDANGAYSACEALAHAEPFADAGVTWFEEPVSSDDLEGLRHVRDRAPPAWMSPPASTATTSITSGGWSPSAPSMSCRRTRRAAPVSPGSCRSLRCATPTTCRYRRTPRRRCTCTRAARSRAFATSSISTITSASSGCCSMGFRSWLTARCGLISRALVSDSC